MGAPLAPIYVQAERSDRVQLHLHTRRIIPMVVAKHLWSWWSWGRRGGLSRPLRLGRHGAPDISLPSWRSLLSSEKAKCSFLRSASFMEEMWWDIRAACFFVGCMDSGSALMDLYDPVVPYTGTLEPSARVILNCLAQGRFCFRMPHWLWGVLEWSAWCSR